MEIELQRGYFRVDFGTQFKIFKKKKSKAISVAVERAYEATLGLLPLPGQ